MTTVTLKITWTFVDVWRRQTPMNPATDLFINI